MKDFWNTRFGTDTYAFGIEANQFFKEELNKLPVGSLLLPGEGEGRNAVFAAKKGWEVTAVDFSVKAQIKANRLAFEHQVEINYILDTLDYAIIPEDSFDAAAFIYVHLENDRFEKIMAKVIKSLKKNGTLIFECFSEKQLGRTSGGPKDLNRLYTIPQVSSALSDMDVQYLQEEEISIDEGEYRKGRAMVIRAVAKIL